MVVQNSLQKANFQKQEKRNMQKLGENYLK